MIINYEISRKKTKEILLKFRKEKLSSYLYQDKDLIILFYKLESRIYKIHEASLIKLLVDENVIHVSDVIDSKQIILRKLKLSSNGKYIVENGFLKFKKERSRPDFANLINNSKVDLTIITKKHLDDRKANGKIVRKHRKAKNYTKTEWNNLVKEIEKKNKLLRGVVVTSRNKIGTELELSVQDGWGFINYDPKTKYVETYVETRHKSNDRAHYYTSGVVANIFNILRPTYVKEKFEKHKFWLGVFGFLVFTGLVFLTFTEVFDAEALNNVFDKMSKSWDEPWPYLFILDYFINTVTWIFIAVLVEFGAGKKPNFKLISKYFLAANIRNLIYAVTGMHMVALASWLYMMKLVTKQKTASLVGNIGSITLITSVMGLLVGIVFTSYGAWYIHTLDWDLVKDQGGLGSTVFNPVVISAMGIIGLLFKHIGAMYFALFTYWKLLQNLVFKGLIYSTTLHPRFGDYFERTEQIDIRINQLRTRGRDRLKDKKFVIRTSLVFAVFLTSELFETTYSVNMYRPEGSPIIWDMFNLTAVEMLVHNSQEAIWWPGGLGMVESMSKNWYMAYMCKAWAPYFDSTEALFNYVTESSSNAAFTERFFNFYLPSMFRMGMLVFAGGFFARAGWKMNKKLKAEGKI